MTAAADTIAQPRVPMWFAIFLCGQVAGFIVSTALWFSHTLWWQRPLPLLVPGLIAGTATMALVYLPLHKLLSALKATSLLTDVTIAFVAFGSFYFLWLDSLVPDAHGAFVDQIYQALSDPNKSLLYVLPFVAVPVGLLFHFLVLHARPLQPFDARDYFIYYTWIAAWAAFGLSLALMGLASSLHVRPADWRHDVLEWTVSAVFALPVLGPITGFARLRSKSAAMVTSFLYWIAPAALFFSFVVIVIPS